MANKPSYSFGFNVEAPGGRFYISVLTQYRPDIAPGGDNAAIEIQGAFGTRTVLSYDDFTRVAANHLQQAGYTVIAPAPVPAYPPPAPPLPNTPNPSVSYSWRPAYTPPTPPAHQGKNTPGTKVYEVKEEPLALPPPSLPPPDYMKDEDW